MRSKDATSVFYYNVSRAVGCCREHSLIIVHTLVLFLLRIYSLRTFTP